MRAEVAAGINPVERKRQDRATAPDRTFKALAERYMKEHAERHKRPRSVAEDRRNLDLHILPRWEKRPYAGITRSDVVELLEGLIAAGKATTANRVQSLISKIFSFAIDAGLRSDHPTHRLAKRHKERVGDRVLTDGEIRLFWPGIVEPPAVRRTGLALRLALLLGVRRNEAAGISRTELADLDNPAAATWTIPGARTKNGRALVLPLPMLALATIHDLLADLPAGQPYLVPTISDQRKGPIAGETLTRAMRYFAGRTAPDDDATPLADSDPVATWTADPPSPHDLRRSVETRLAALRVPKDIRDKILNHVEADVGSRHYDRHSYLPEKRDALTKWNDALAALLRVPTIGARVVPFAARGG